MASREPLVTTASATDQYGILLPTCSCSKTPYFVCGADSGTLNARPAVLGVVPEGSSSGTRHTGHTALRHRAWGPFPNGDTTHRHRNMNNTALTRPQKGHLLTLREWKQGSVAWVPLGGTAGRATFLFASACACLGTITDAPPVTLRAVNKI